MNKLRSTALAAIALLALNAPLAHAGPLPSAGLTASEAAAWLNGSSLTASIQKDKDGEDYVKVAGPINWDFNLYDCDKVAPIHCKSVQFSAGWTGTYTQDAGNAWNRDWRYLKSFVTEDGKAIWVQYDVALTTGMTYEELNQHLARWRDRVVTFNDTVIIKKDGK